MNEKSPPVGFAVIRTKVGTGRRDVVWQWSVDAPPHYRQGENWRKFYPNTEHYTYELHAIEGEPVAETVEASS